MLNVKDNGIKFIICNVFICAIALVAGFCMIFMPWLDIRIHIEGEKLSSILFEENSATAEVSVTPYSISSLGTSQEDLIAQEIKKGLKDESFDIPVNLPPMKMLGLATGDRGEIEEVFNSSIGEKGAGEILKGFVGQLAPIIIEASLNVAIDEIFNTDGGLLSQEDKEQIENYKTKVEDALDNIAENPTSENAKAQFNSVVDLIVAESNGEIQESDVEKMRSVIEEIIEQGANDGNLDYVYLITNLDVDALDEILNDSTQPEPASLMARQSAKTSITGFATQYEGESGGETTTNPLIAVIEMLENPGAFVADSLDENSLNIIKIVSIIALIVFVAIPVLLCFLLAIFSVLRIFMQNKGVRIWYANVTFIISAILMLGVNIFAKFILPTLDLGSGVGTIVSAFSITLLGSGIVTACCGVTLTLFYFIFYRRLKRNS